MSRPSGPTLLPPSSDRNSAISSPTGRRSALRYCHFSMPVVKVVRVRFLGCRVCLDVWGITLTSSLHIQETLCSMASRRVGLLASGPRPYMLYPRPHITPILNAGLRPTATGHVTNIQHHHDDVDETHETTESPGL